MYTHIISQGGTVPFLHPCHQLIFCSKWLDLDLRSCNTLQDGLAQVAAQRVAVPSSMPQTQEESQDETTLSQASTMPWLGLETGGGHMNKREREIYIYITYKIYILCIYMYFNIKIYLSTYLYIYIPSYLSIYQSIYNQPICLCIDLSVGSWLDFFQRYGLWDYGVLMLLNPGRTMVSRV